MRCFYAAACWAAFWLGPLLALAQAAPAPWRFEHLTVNTGLAHSDAMTVVQDREGFIWVGTNRGLDRYDGQQLKNYPSQPDDPASLSSNRIRKLYVDPGGRLWAGTENDGLNYYDREKDRFLRFSAAPVRPASQPAARQLARAFITGLAADKRGNLWVGTQTGGLFVAQPDGRGQYRALHHLELGSPPAPAEISEVKAAPDGTIWIGSSQGLYCAYPPPPGQPPAAPRRVALPALATARVQALHLDRQANLWVGAGNQVYCLPPRPAEAAPGGADAPAPVLSSRFLGLSSLLLDSFGRLWVGTEFGIYLVHPAGEEAGLPPPLSKAFRPGLVEHLVPEYGVATSLSSARTHHSWVQSAS